MVRTRSGPTEYKFVASKRCPNGELPSDPLTDRHRQTPKLCKKPLSQFIIAPRAQASRRCETQASLSGKAAKLWLAFRSLDLFRALREPDRRRRDEKRPCRSEQKTATNQNDYLTGKAPYKSCELAISRRIADCISRSRTDTLPVHIAVRCPCSCSGGEASSDIRGLSARLNINTPLPLRNLRETALHQRLSGSDDLKPIVPAVQRFEPASKCCSISSLTRSGASASGR